MWIRISIQAESSYITEAHLGIVGQAIYIGRVSTPVCARHNSVMQLNNTRKKQMEQITIKTLAQATEQQVFNQAVIHLLTQNARSISGTDCLYRGPNGTKCAAGCFIGDDEYNATTMENMVWVHFVHERIAPQEHKVLITALQRIHDGSEPQFWPDKFRQLADDNGLELPELLVERLKATQPGTL